MNAEHHDAVTTVSGSFEKTRNAILTLIDNDIPLQISCPVMKINKDDYGGVLRWAHEHKVRAVTDYIMMARFDHTTGNLANRLSIDEVVLLRQCCGRAVTRDMGKIKGARAPAYFAHERYGRR